MAKRIEVGKIYLSKGTKKIVCVLEIDRNNLKYYFLEEPEIILDRYIPDARMWWDDV